MASQRKLHVFRVIGLSRELPDEDVKTALQQALNESFTDNEKSYITTEITIVPLCYKSEIERAALVQFRDGIPRFLYKLRVDPLRD